MNQIGRITQTILPSFTRQPAETTGSFGETLRAALTDIERLQVSADTATMNLVAGKVDDFHEVVIKSEKATLGLQLAVSVRNKVLEAYLEVMRTQV